MPITVISTNFSQEFNKLKRQKEIMKARMTLLKSLNNTQRCVSIYLSLTFALTLALTLALT